VFGPTATALLDGAPRAGLAEVLAGEVTLEAGTRNIRTVPHLRVLAPGLDPDRADALLQTTGLRTLIDDMLATASYVVIEAPPTTDSPDAQTLAGVADLAVLVVEAGQSSAREVVDASAQVEAMQADVLGAVVARYEHDPRQKRRGAAALPAAEDEVQETATPTAEPADAAEKPADAATVAPAASANGSANGSAAPVVTGSANGSAGPAVDHDHHAAAADGDTTAVLPTGGRPQLVPPGPAGPAKR